jgi:DNA invertase Pin-like site-specific DNA recombinase
MNELLGDLDRGRIDVVVVYKLDRRVDDDASGPEPGDFAGMCRRMAAFRRIHEADE